MERGEGNREKLSHCAGMNGFSSDLLQKFLKQSCNQDGNEQEEDEEGLELSLGLSMNGRFGVDPVRKKLKRSSSISNLVFAVGSVGNGSSQQQARVEEFDTYAPLPRTRSLPTEAEEEWRRRKEFQSMRRMEARKKRMEKLRNVRVQKEKENSVEIGDGLVEDVSKNVHGKRIDNGSAGSKFENGNEVSSSQGSIGSQRSGSGSSGISDLELEGGNQTANIVAPSSQPLHDQNEQESPSRAADRDAKFPNKSLKSAMFDMPYVSTKGDGPNGRKIEGFLYRYKKGEEVRIVCVCHGLFLTPAEFIKHGGGDDVEHPLKHIVVNPFPLM